MPELLIQALQNRWLTEKEVAELTGFAIQTLRNDRHRCKGLPYSKKGRSVRYRLGDIAEFMESNKVIPDNR
jgi:hypothetical protein